MQPLQHSIYKGMTGKHGALQLNLQPPHFFRKEGKVTFRDFTGEEALVYIDGKPTRKTKDDWKLREGAIFFEACSSSGKNVYDWKKSIRIALSMTDIGKILAGWEQGKEVDLLHDPGAGGPNRGKVLKKITITKPTSQGVMFFVKMREDGEDRQHQIPISPDELVVLRILFTKAVSSALNW